MLKKLISNALIYLGLSMPASASSLTAFDFEFTDVSGKPYPLSQHKGKVLMIVNTASKCGFTPQYEALNNVYEKFKDKGLVVIAVPSNDFGGQEPLSNSEIKEFCELQFKTKFPIMSKATVIGENADPFYKWANEQAGVFGKPKWNFHKYIIGKDGKLKEWFSSITKPDDAAVLKAIENALAE